MAEASRIDWQAIKARWNTETEVFHLALLPKGAAQLFLAICDRLQWEATYRVENYDYSDWDELQRIVDLGIAGLTDTMRLSDLIAHVDEVEGLLRQLRDRPCCGSGATDTIPNPGEGAGGIAPVGSDDQVPDYTDDTDIVTNPPQTSFTDADEDAETTGPEMVEYLCAAAHWYYDLLHRWLSFMKLYSTLGGLVWEPVSAIINIVVSKYGGTNPIATIAAEVADQLVNLWPEVNNAMVDAIIAELEANRDDIICALAYERNLAGMISAVYSQLQTITTALGYLNMLPMVSYPVFALALVSQGLIDLSDVEGSCDGCDSGDSLGDLYGEWYFDATAEGWTGGQYDANTGYPDPGTYYHGNFAQWRGWEDLPASGTATIKVWMRNRNTGSQGTAAAAIRYADSPLGTSSSQNLSSTWTEHTFTVPYTGATQGMNGQLGILITMSGASLVDVDSVRVWIASS